MKIKKLLVIILIFSMLCGCKDRLSKKTVAKFKADGLQYLANEEYEKAIESLLKVIDYDDEENTITIALSQAYAGTESYNEAIRLLEKINNANDQALTKTISKYRGANYLKSTARVDWDTFANSEWTYVGAFNNEYFKYGIADLYGLLDLDFNVVLEAQYYDIFTWGGPFNGQIMVFKTAKDYAISNLQAAVILDDSLKETNKKVPIFGWNADDFIGYFVDMTNSNVLMNMEVTTVEGERVYQATPATTIDKDSVVGGANLNSDGLYEMSDQFFLVTRKDMTVHKIDGLPQDYYYGIYQDRAIINEMITVRKGGKCGYYNLSAVKVSSFEYDALGDDENSYSCGTYSQGYVVVYLDKQYGLLDKNGKLIVDTKFDAMTDIAKGKFLVIYEGKIGLATLR